MCARSYASVSACVCIYDQFSEKSNLGGLFGKIFFHNFAHMCHSVQNTKFGTPTVSIFRHTAHFTSAGQMYKIYRMCTDYVVTNGSHNYIKNIIIRNVKLKLVLL